jgi:hypothetical protein
VVDVYVLEDSPTEQRKESIGQSNEKTLENKYLLCGEGKTGDHPKC